MDWAWPGAAETLRLTAATFQGSLKKGGLTEFGRELVKEAEDLHMILDLSHLSDEGVEDVLSITSCPVIASHSNSGPLPAATGT